jgi:hypothetical protein
VTQLVRLVALGVLVLGVATACGEEREKKRAGKACGPAPTSMSGSPKLLPANFPTPSGVTYTSEKRAGPASIVNGYVAGGVGGAFDSYKQALNGGGYTVTKDEHEEVDAEVNFSDGSSTGQVKLVQECADRTSVTITARPD